MGFYLMIGSMLLGLFALKIGFSHLKEKKVTLSSILTSCLGTASSLCNLVRIAKIRKEASVVTEVFGCKSLVVLKKYATLTL